MAAAPLRIPIATALSIVNACSLALAMVLPAVRIALDDGAIGRVTAARIAETIVTHNRRARFIQLDHQPNRPHMPDFVRSSHSFSWVNRPTTAVLHIEAELLMNSAV